MFKPHEFAKKIGVSVKTLQRWDVEGKLPAKRTLSGHRFYFYPSSKTCSHCGYKKENLSLSERIYHCENCGFEMDRDLNAAIKLIYRVWLRRVSLLRDNRSHA
ncbi:zinc ribbon domain-containing protein, partial [Anabaena sp. FACHB-1237]|uniref:zinc ribbon domain-containing protein n=1 Tax=Anabaena sp. FACHB-1237 TaxID=2692769 RepID=UPI001F5519D1